MHASPIRVSQGDSLGEGAAAWPVWRQRLVFFALLLFLTVYWGVGLLILLTAGAFSRLFCSEKERSELGRQLLGGLFHGLTSVIELTGAVHVRRENSERLKSQSGPVIIAPNHPALWDVLFMLDLVRDAACIMKSGLRGNPLLSQGAQFAGFLPNAPKLAMVKSAVAHLGDGGKLIIFPEGTRSGQGSVGDFRPGVALIAKESGAPVLPVFIRTSSSYLSKGWPLLKPPEFPITIEISVGEPQRVADGEQTRDFSERLRKLYAKTLSGG